MPYETDEYKTDEAMPFIPGYITPLSDKAEDLHYSFPPRITTQFAQRLNTQGRPQQDQGGNCTLNPKQEMASKVLIEQVSHFVSSTLRAVHFALEGLPILHASGSTFCGTLFISNEDDRSITTIALGRPRIVVSSLNNPSYDIEMSTDGAVGDYDLIEANPKIGLNYTPQIATQTLDQKNEHRILISTEGFPRRCDIEIEYPTANNPLDILERVNANFQKDIALFIAHLKSSKVYKPEFLCVANGHGEKGHYVSTLLCQLMKHILPAYIQGKDLSQSLKELPIFPLEDPLWNSIWTIALRPVLTDLLIKCLNGSNQIQEAISPSIKGVSDRLNIYRYSYQTFEGVQILRYLVYLIHHQQLDIAQMWYDEFRQQKNYHQIRGGYFCCFSSFALLEKQVRTLLQDALKKEASLASADPKISASSLSWQSNTNKTESIEAKPV